MKIGFLYAGQGSQHPGMGADLYEAYPAFRQVLDSGPVDFDLKEVCFADSGKWRLAVNGYLFAADHKTDTHGQ